MTAAELKAAGDPTQAELVKNLDTLRAQLLEAEAMMSEHEAAIVFEGGCPKCKFQFGAKIFANYLNPRF
jgi:hypothetical protein